MTPLTCAVCGSEYPRTASACPTCGMAPSAQERALPMGTELHDGKFAIGRVLGEGGFGITYKGAHKNLQRPVAIKELFPEGAVRLGTNVAVPPSRQAEFKRELDSILQEARLIASLSSPNIVEVHDMFTENGTAYIVMEYLEGQTLQEQIDALGPITPDVVAQIALEACSALAAVHDNNLLHRDVKPANIVLTQDGRTVLIDFGSAREYHLSQTGRHTRILTEDYAALEQYSTNARFGPYTDIYCLGATLFHALTGTPPPRALDRMQDPGLTLAFPRDVPDALRTAVRAALHLKVQERPQQVSAFRKLLEEDKPPAASAPAPSVSSTTASASPAPTGHAYVFKGKTVHSPQELSAALSADWDAALVDWKRGYIRRWLTRASTGSDMERKIDDMLEDPFFAGANAERANGQSGSPSDTLDEVILERQLLRVMALMDPAWPPSYRGMPIQDKQSMCAWLKEKDKDEVVTRFLHNDILRAHPKVFGQKLHAEMRAQARTCYGHLANKGVIDLDFEDWWRLPVSTQFKYEILLYLVDAKSAKATGNVMKEDRKSMSIKWYRKLVEDAADSAGKAASLALLQPLACKARNRRNAWTFTLVALCCLSGAAVYGIMA